MAKLFDEDYQFDLPGGIKEIDAYLDCIYTYLRTGKSNLRPKQYMRTYTYIVKLSDESDQAEDLYEIYKTKLTEYINRVVNPAINTKINNSREFLVEYVQQWKQYSILVFAAKKMFDYLDRYYLKNGAERAQNLTETALGKFKDLVFQDKVGELRKSILEEIQKDRLNEIVDRDLIKDSIWQFMYMGFEKKTTIKKVDMSGEIHWVGQKNLPFYDQNFEGFLLQSTNSFYMKKAQTWADQYNCFEYIQKIASHLQKEEKNADFFLQQETKPKILEITLRNCVENQAEALTLKESGCEYMFNERKIDHLALMYNVFSGVPSTLKFIISKMNPYIMKEGTKIVKNDENLSQPIKFTQKLLEFKLEMDQLIERAFQNDMKFQKARDLSFQNFMNECDKSPHFIAFYTDNEFRRGMKQVSEDEIEKRLDAVIRLFCCLHGRDTFIASYTNLLAQRLLNKTSVSNQAEELMIKKLQVECGHNTVNKIKTMFEDMIKGQQVMSAFRQRNNGSNIIDDTEFTTEILTSGHWPYQDVPKCKIPKQLQTIQSSFTMFYKKKFANREIMWLFNHGTVQLQTQYLNKSYQIVVSCFQTSILCLFNEYDVLTYKQIQEKCSISDQDLKESMMKLCNPKIKLILKQNPKPVFAPDEQFRLNSKFENNNIRFNLVPIPSSAKMADGAGGIKSTTDLDAELVKERSMIIDAVVVRIMKSRKVEMHNGLIESVIKQVTMFQAQPAMIKKRIESLIERDYLERDKNDKGKYIYKP